MGQRGFIALAVERVASVVALTLSQPEQKPTGMTFQVQRRQRDAAKLHVLSEGLTLTSTPNNKGKLRHKWCPDDNRYQTLEKGDPSPSFSLLLFLLPFLLPWGDQSLPPQGQGNLFPPVFSFPIMFLLLTLGRLKPFRTWLQPDSDWLTRHLPFSRALWDGSGVQPSVRTAVW